MMLDTTNIYRGLYQGAAFGDWYEAWDLFDAIISLVATSPVRPCPPGKLHVAWKIEDWEVPEDTDALWALVGLVVDLVRRNKRVLVHCGAGINRSGLVCALAYRELSDCSGTEAEDAIRTLRPNSLSNPYFVRFLHALDGEINVETTTLGGGPVI